VSKLGGAMPDGNEDKRRAEGERIVQWAEDQHL